MVDIGNLIRKTHNLSLERMRHQSGLMVQNTVPHFPCEIQPLSILLQLLHDTHTLFVVPESILAEPV